MKNIKIIKKLSITLLIVMAISSCAIVSPKKNRTLEVLMNAVSHQEILFGHQDSYFYGKKWDNITEPQDIPPIISDIFMVCSDYPAVLGCDLGGIELGSDRNLDKVPFTNMRQAIIEQHRMGGIVTLSWHLRNPVTDGDSWDIICDTVVRAILPGNPYNQKFQVWLDRVAEFMLTLKDDQGKQIPVIFRPWHEHSGSWFWWGEKLCSPEEYIALWKYTHKYLTKKGLTDIVWAYSPSSDFDKSEYLKKYPGDDYVDILGMDAYHYGGEAGTTAFIENLQKKLMIIDQIAKEHHKISALTETGYETVIDPKWWTETLLKGVEESSISYLLLWRNAWDRYEHYYAPFPGQISEADFNTFYNLPKTIFLHDLK